MKREGIPFDGFGSVLEMLTKADVKFRDKILTNIRKRDPYLARRLEAGLQGMAMREEEDSRVTLERSQRAATARSYGR